MNSSLDGCLVLDLSRLLPGPYCSMILGDHGARVISIEDERFRKDALDITKGVNRNKEHITLNLKSNLGKEVFFKLAKKADVIIEGFRPGAVSRLGIDYEEIKKINPKIIYCSITGYGQNGQNKDMAGHDVNFMGYSGALSLIGYEDKVPCIPGIQISDMVGGMNAAIGILLALFERQKSGSGQYIDISMTDSVTALLPLMAGMLKKDGKNPVRGNNLLSHKYACYNVYETKDKKSVTVGALEPRFWKKLCELLNISELADLQFNKEKRTELIEKFKIIFKEKTRDEWMNLLEKEDVCVGKVLFLDETLNGKIAKERGMVKELDGYDSPLIATPIKLSKTPGVIKTAPPEFGKNTKKVLSELGYSTEERGMFKERRYNINNTI